MRHLTVVDLDRIRAEARQEADRATRIHPIVWVMAACFVFDGLVVWWWLS